MIKWGLWPRQDRNFDKKNINWFVLKLMCSKTKQLRISIAELKKDSDKIIYWFCRFSFLLGFVTKLRPEFKFTAKIELVFSQILVIRLWSNESLVFLLISNLFSWLHLHQLLGTNNTEANKSLKTDANGAN